MDQSIYQKLLTLIKGYWTSVQLSERYDQARYSIIFGESPIEPRIQNDIRNAGDNYQQNLLLKEKLSAVYGGTPSNAALNFWVIRRWGGISSFKESHKNQERIKNFYQTLTKEHTSAFQCIASMSKVASFVNPKSFFVFDSRVAYSLNWLLVEAGERSNFFPIPDGRSTLARNCDLNGYLHHLSPNPYRNLRVSYWEYCQLIQRLYADIEPGGVQPYKLEMLLFQIAPNEIKDEMIKALKGTEYYQKEPSKKKMMKQKNAERIVVPGRTVEEGIKLCINGNSNHILYIGKNGKGPNNTKLPYFCQLFLDEKKGDLKKTAGPTLLKALSSVLTFMPPKAKAYIFSTNETTYEEAKAVYEKALAILLEYGANPLE